MALDQDGNQIGDIPVRNIEGDPIGEVMRVSYFDTTTGEVMLEMRIDADPVRYGFGFSGMASMRIPVWDVDPQHEASEVEAQREQDPAFEPKTLGALIDEVAAEMARDRERKQEQEGKRHGERRE